MNARTWLHQPTTALTCPLASSDSHNTASHVQRTCGEQREKGCHHASLCATLHPSVCHLLYSSSSTLSQSCAPPPPSTSLTAHLVLCAGVIEREPDTHSLSGPISAQRNSGEHGGEAHCCIITMCPTAPLSVCHHSSMHAVTATCVCCATTASLIHCSHLVLYAVHTGLEREQR